MGSRSNPPDVPEMENFVRLQYLITNVASRFLRQCFQELWKSLGNSDWQNTIQFGELFTNGIGRFLFAKCLKIQKTQLAQGNTELWDVPLLIDAIKVISPKHTHSQAFDRLKEVRNFIAHAGNVNMKKSLFDETWTKATKALVTLGLSPQEIETAGKISLQKMQDEEPPKETESQKEFMALKLKANDAFNKKNFFEAHRIYSTGLQLPNLSNDELALLYSNRSLTNVKLGRLEDAKDDAKSCITLRPMWFKSYARLTVAYQGMKKLEKALKNSEIAASLAPNNEDLLHTRDALRHDVAKLEMKEHLDPSKVYRSRSDADDISQMMERTGMTVFSQNPHMTNSILEDHPSRLCQKGHKYKNGARGVTVDFEIAAKYFSQAARMGNAQGMYNLALMTREGKGVKRNLAEGHKLLLQAAEQPETTELLPGSGTIVRNFGVAEARCTIGLAYANGVAVKADMDEAIKWYEKAMEYGDHFSVNNLACHYEQNGLWEKAFLYRKLAVLKGNVRSMETFAKQYLALDELDLSLKYLLCALRHGSWILVEETQFPFEVTEEQKKNFDFEQLKADLTQELMKSHLKRFVISKDYDYDQVAKRVKTKREIPGSVVNPDPESESYKTDCILQHRDGIKWQRGFRKIGQEWYGTAGKFVPKRDIDLIGLQPMTFKDFDVSIPDKIYEGRIVKVTNVEDANVKPPSIVVLAQDVNGDLQRVGIYNYQNFNVNGVQDELGFGCRISIVNPYFRMCKDGMFGIRIDDPNTIFKHPQMTDKKMCRSCYKPGGTVLCRKCRRVYYCSKACMRKDEEMQHELVCVKKI